MIIIIHSLWIVSLTLRNYSFLGYKEIFNYNSKYSLVFCVSFLTLPLLFLLSPGDVLLNIVAKLLSLFQLSHPIQMKPADGQLNSGKYVGGCYFIHRN